MDDVIQRAEGLPDAFEILRDIGREPGKWAIFLDIDGTLLDIAETPDGVVVPHSIGSHLRSASDMFEGALACVTGRSIDYVDLLFSKPDMPVAGLHGAERRDAAGVIERAQITPLLQAIKTELAVKVAEWPGAIIEDKGAAIAVHFRLAPEWQDAVLSTMQEMVAKAGAGFTLQHGKMVVEMRPARADKGQAVAAFMAEPPFSGRIPVTFGDDVTDEAMFAVANDTGGVSVKIGQYGSFPGLARYSLTSPAQLRAWLADLSSIRPTR